MHGAVAQAIAIGQRWDLELPVDQKDGTRMWVRAVGLAECEHGIPVRLVGAFQDITARYGTEARLAISESQFRGSFEAATHGIALVSLRGQFLQTNKSLCNMFGYSESALIGTDFQAITPPNERSSDLRPIEALLRGDVDTDDSEKRYMHQEGRTVWAQLSVSLVRTLDGTPTHFVAQIQNITQNLTARLQTLLDAASDTIHVIDRHGDVQQCNLSFALLLGYTVQETARLTSATWTMLAPEELHAEIARLIAQPHAFETQYRHKDGSVLTVEVNGKGVLLDGEHILYASARDISARKQAERALEQGHMFAQNILYARGKTAR